MRKLLWWREGALNRIKGGNFAMNPYAPPPNHTNCYWSTAQKSEYWCKGYWWADKNKTA
tara:strand:- start:673 stop:849 length:177 start_codon:yes stop_codon:yes gene_type:complete